MDQWRRLVFYLSCLTHGKRFCSSFCNRLGAWGYLCIARFYYWTILCILHALAMLTRTCRFSTIGLKLSYTVVSTVDQPSSPAASFPSFFERLRYMQKSDQSHLISFESLCLPLLRVLVHQTLQVSYVIECALYFVPQSRLLQCPLASLQAFHS